jgi:hypothetical protein
MKLSRFFQHKVDIYRLTTTVSSGRKTEAWESIQTSVPCSIQPVSEELIALGQGDFFDTANIFFPENTNIKVGDKSVQGEIEYIAKGVQKKDYGFTQNHIKVSSIKK